MNIILLHKFVLDDFMSLEERDAKKDIERCRMAIDREISAMNILTKDWANWDDTYKFAVDKNQQYIDSNVNLELFSINNINLLCIFNTSGKVVAKQIYDKELETLITLKEFPDALDPSHFLLDHKNIENNKSGIYITEKGYMLLSSYPVLDSNGRGPSHGTIITGRFITEELIKSLSEQTRVNFVLAPIDEQITAANIHAKVSPVKSDNISIRAVNDTTLEISEIYNDITGKPAFIIKVTVNREISQRGRMVFRLSILSIIIIGALIIFFIDRLLGHYIFSPLSSLTRNVLLISEKKDLSISLKSDSSDEIGILTGEFERMRHWIKDTNDRLKEMNKNLEQRIHELDYQINVKEQALIDLAAAQSSLIEMSRAAGMAEVATGVLHNVGNVLNSVNVSCTLLMDQLRESRVVNVSKVAALIAEAEGGLSHFFTEDNRGRQIPAYLSSLANSLQEEHKIMVSETESLHSRIEHIKEIVSMQQSYGRVSGINETISPEQLMEDALKLNEGSLLRHGITVQRHYQQVLPVTIDKHKVLQILLNLINNANSACTSGDGSTGREKIITLRIFNPDPDRVIIQVADNGTGISPENLTRIFQHGFTTRKDGHGFGLHSGSLSARELGGSLTVHSDGEGLGAKFSLELPYYKGNKI